MRTDQASTGVAHAVFAGARVDVVAVGGFDAAIEHGACDVVLDISRATEVEGEAVVLLAWLAQKLENAGGRLSVTARRENRGVRVTRTLWMGDLTGSWRPSRSRPGGSASAHRRSWRGGSIVSHCRVHNWASGEPMQFGHSTAPPGATQPATLPRTAARRSRTRDPSQLESRRN
jgi:hypothetical protein